MMNEAYDDLREKWAEIPAFEITVDGRKYEIFASGNVKGAEGASVIVVNRIPRLMHESLLVGVDYAPTK